MKNTNKTPELLAPAGSTDAFYAAIDAGADAVYLGLGDFNARLRAKNFTARDLSALVPYAHTRGVKVYATVNTLIKQSEIKPALDLLYQLDQTGIDAVIIADIGLMKLAADNFPKLRLHASTQAAVHNSHGAAFMKSLGAKRVVLARELSIDEIRETVKKSPIETEVFVHGALCYSLSGMCLASSFIGGGSGNRGRCTQVCRRRFRMVDGEQVDGYFFSPYDLQAVSVIDRLIDYGVSSFKIEGRMKGAEYVSTVVKAYRRAIDSSGENLREITDALRFDFGRDKTAFFLDGRGGEGETPIDPSRPSGTGILVGVIVECGDASFTLSTDISILKDDRLRVQPESGFEGSACRVFNCVKLGDSDNLVKIYVSEDSDIKCNAGDYVFLIGRKNQSQIQSQIQSQSQDHLRGEVSPSLQRKWASPIFFSATPSAGGSAPRNAPYAKTDMQSNPTINVKKPTLWFKADSVEWLELLVSSPCQRLIFDADVEEIELLLNSPEIIRVWRSRLIVSLPPFIEETRLDFWRGIVKKCLAAGLESFAISNPGHFALVNGAKVLTADAPLWCLNRSTQEILKSRGAAMFVYSYEDEYLNIRNTVCDMGITGIMPVYCRPPLFVSRMPSAVDCGITIADPHGNEFFVSKKNNLYYTLPNTPVCLFAKRKKLSECGIENFLIDVSFQKPDYATVNKLVQGFRENIRIDNGSIFNFKAGLR